MDGDKEANTEASNALIVRNQRAETKKNEATSLESLRETILELKKSLNETDKKRRENSKNLDTWSVKEKQSNKQEQKKRTAGGGNNYKKSENDDESIKKRFNLINTCLRSR